MRRSVQKSDTDGQLNKASGQISVLGCVLEREPPALKQSCEFQRQLITGFDDPQHRLQKHHAPNR